eukprot:GABV01003808.1.p1 GENE.GABV01003808.1~~GABV01003808.1.p1  ORF type:complete len:148 (-),score=25.48 GABV01003808.1:7-450(-)
MAPSGTVVFEGRCAGRRVAVKRLLREFFKHADQEIRLLISTDQHPNVLRYFAKAEDSSFLYLALERCQCSLAEAVRPKPLTGATQCCWPFPSLAPLNNSRQPVASPLLFESEECGPLLFPSPMTVNILHQIFQVSHICMPMELCTPM